MEIIFNKLSYIDKGSSDKNLLNDINVVIKEGSIVSFFGNDLDIIAKLLFVIKRPSSGELKLNDIVIKRTSHINNIEILRSKIGYVSDSILFIKKTVKDEIKNVIKNYNYKVSNISKHIDDSLTMVGLDSSYMDRDIDTLSYTEKKRLSLATVLSYNPEVIILDNFFKGFTYRDKEYFRKLFIKLKTKYKKTIILLTNDLVSTFMFVDKIYVINNGNLVLAGAKELYYQDKLYKYTDIPKIVEFTKYAQLMGHDINEYTELKELLKELYRNVK